MNSKIQFGSFLEEEQVNLIYQTATLDKESTDKKKMKEQRLYIGVECLHHPLMLCLSSGTLQRPPPRTVFANSVLSVGNSLSSMSNRIKSIILYFTTSHLPSLDQPGPKPEWGRWESFHIEVEIT